MHLLWVFRLCVRVRMGSRHYWKRAYVPSQLQKNKGKELPYSSICQPARDVSWSYWYDCMRRLDGNVYIAYFTEIKCWAWQAVMRWIKSSRLLLMHEAVRTHCWTLLRGIGVLTNCHSLPALSLAPLSQGLCWSLSASVRVFTVNDWMLVSGEPLYSYYGGVSKEPRGEITQARTLLWISHGLAIADRSHAVIIMALEITHNWDDCMNLCWRLLHMCTCVFMPTWQSLCVWSPASCILSSRSSSRRSSTGPRSSGTLFSFCMETKH